MARASRVERTRRIFAEITAALEDAALVASDGQGAPDAAAARQVCNRLIKIPENCLERLHRLQERIE